MDMKINQREKKMFYIGADDNEIKTMLKELGLKDLSELYKHIDKNVLMNEAPAILPYMNQIALKTHMEDLAKKNKIQLSFLGDGLPVYSVSHVTAPVCNIRGLTTAYTPYQPERSQGTLQTLWIYQNAISQLTGFEAINASLYDRSTCLHEAMNCALRLTPTKKTVVIASTIYPGDIEVINTLIKETNLEVVWAPLNLETGTLDLDQYKKLIENQDVGAVAFAQVNSFGNIENFHDLTNLAHAKNLKVIGIIDPIHLVNSGLTEPVSWGEHGADIIIGEGQHLAIGPNFGGPGLGIFGIRFNEKDKNSIRSTSGRYIGRAKDLKGLDCKVMVLNTREQHIRREKATSNICSNQSFVATIAGAAILSRGSEELTQMLSKAQENLKNFVAEVLKLEGVELKFKNAFNLNEVTLKLNKNVDDFIYEGVKEGINVGINISGRAHIKENLLLVSFNDTHTSQDILRLLNFFKKNFSVGGKGNPLNSIANEFKRKNKFQFNKLDAEKLIHYYQKLGAQNLSPDDGIYPLGSCTMKYNPVINDWAASLSGFTDIHPEAHEAIAQGSLEVLYGIQEMFKAITGLPGVTTQPVAGAQGELVGLKLFQAYHRDHGGGRDLLLIPKSAHGTNPATATMAGFETKNENGIPYGIITIEALSNGEMNLDQVKEYCEKFGNRIAGVMVTNPNTAGIFETNFKKMSEMIHQVGGLVYMDGANMNAIAGWVDLNKLGVDAVHNNLHKTWTIPHGGGGPGDAIVAVSEKLIDYLPGVQVQKTKDGYKTFKTKKSIGSFHRHFGNFAHKVRAYTYLRALGPDGVRKMSAVAVLSARYLYHKLSKTLPVLPVGSQSNPRMHEFILTLSEETFKKIENAGVPKAQAIARIGKLFLDFGFHAPTVAFPEQFGLMIEPTETYTKDELDHFCQMVETIFKLINDHPEVLKTVPHFTPIDRVEDVQANKNLCFKDPEFKLDEIYPDRVNAKELQQSNPAVIVEKILAAHQKAMNA
jgi:glycine dehydrogenase